MKIWDLKVYSNNDWPHLTWGCVVIAPTEERARQVASEGCDGADDWKDSGKVQCRETLPEEFSTDCLLMTSDICSKCEGIQSFDLKMWSAEGWSHIAERAGSKLKVSVWNRVKNFLNGADADKK